MTESSDSLTHAQLSPYMGELQHQGQMTELATDLIRNALPGGPNEYDTAMTWGGIQLVLSSSAGVSHLLYPTETSGFSKRRGRALVEALGVGDIDTLKDRTLRNRSEHIDARLDMVVKVGGTVVNHNQGPIDFIQGIDPERILRHWDPSIDEFSLFGKSVSLEQLRWDTIRVGRLAAAWEWRHRGSPEFGEPPPMRTADGTPVDLTSPHPPRSIGPDDEERPAQP